MPLLAKKRVSCSLALLAVAVLCYVQSGLAVPHSPVASKQAQLIQTLAEHVILPSGSISIKSSNHNGALSASRLAHALAGPSNEESLHPTFTQLSFTAFGRSFDLSLEKNHELLSPNYVEERIDGTTGAVVSRKTRSEVLNCYYRGSVKSWSGPSMNLVAVETCSGLRGAIHAFGASYWIEPLESSAQRSLAAADHLLYRLADLPRDNNVYTCGVNNEPLNFQWLFNREDDISGDVSHASGPDHTHEGHSHSHSHSHSHPRTFGVPLPQSRSGSGSSSDPRPRLMTNTNYYVELAIMNDLARFNHHRLDTETNSGVLFNLAAGYYSASTSAFLTDSVVLILVAQKTVVNGTDPWPVVLDNNGQINPEWLLTNFTDYQDVSMSTPALAHDDAMLLSGLTFKQPTIGLAWIGGVCDSGGQAGVVQANHYTNNPFDAATLAHELGHNLGMCHDPPGTRDSNYCPTLSTPNPSTACASSIMSTSSDPNNPASTFSPCSGEDFRANLITRAPSCLGVPPTSRSWFNTSTCGNGFIENGEGCDCRGYADCSQAPGDWYDPCCNGTSCQLLAGSSCSLTFGCCRVATNGSCEVVPASASKVCKAADSSSCLLESVCTGSSAVCPTRATDNDCNSGLVDKAKEFFQNNWMWILLGGGVLVVLGLFYTGFKRCTSDPKAEKEQRRAKRREAKAKAQEKRDIAMAERASLHDSQRAHAPAFNVGAGSAPAIDRHHPPAYNPASAPVHAHAAPAAPAAPAPQVLQLPPGWTVVMVDGQHPVYINEATGEQYDFRTMAPQGSAMYS